METTRRNFLKIVAAVGAASVAPLRLLEADEPLADGDKLVAMIRETFRLDISSPFTIVRHDVRTRTIQLGVDGLLAQDGEAWYRNADLAAAREAAVEVLRHELATRNINVADLLPLPPIDPMQFNRLGTFPSTWTGFSG